MSSKNVIYVFDFDGTIINGDSLFFFLKFVFGFNKILFGIVILSPWLLAYKLKIISNSVAKEKLFRYFFSGTKESVFIEMCDRFKDVLNSKINECIVEYINRQDCRKIIVSASPELWILPWAKQYGIEVVATQLEVNNGYLTGRFNGRNCYCNEKVDRLKSYLRNRNVFYLIGFGNSDDDAPILKYCNQSYMIKRKLLKKYE